jgi:hypothetical protein
LWFRRREDWGLYLENQTFLAPFFQFDAISSLASMR